MLFFQTSFLKKETQFIRVMKLTTVLLFVATMQLSANSFAQKITLKLDNVSLDKVFREIKRQTGYLFLYNNEEINKVGKVSINQHDVGIENVMDQVLSASAFSYRIVDMTIILTKRLEPTNPTTSVQPPTTLMGIVTDPQGNPLADVSITIKGSTKGTTTDSKGMFTIKEFENNTFLTFSSVGYESKTIKVKDGTTIKVVLSFAVKAIEEMVVIGYGTQKKVTVTGAISSIKAEDILKAPVSSVANALAGRTTGVIAVQRGGEPGRDISDIFIRGIATFAGGNSAKPLILVDGVERSLSGIDPFTIESLNILKDASATAVFGVRGANGVIIITTKTGAKGKPQFSFSTNLARQNPINLPKLLNAVDYATLRNEAEVNDLNNPSAKKFSDNDIERYRKGDDPYFHPDINWTDYMLKRYAPQNQYNLNISGGSQDAKYFVSLGYLNQDGAYKFGDFFKQFSANPNYKRYNIRSNFDFNISKDFTIAIKTSSEIGSSNYSNSSTSDFFGTVLSANPVMTPVIYDGKIVRNVDGLTAFQISNTPLYQLLQNGYNANYSSRLNTNLALKYKLDALLKGLSVRSMIAYDSYYLQAIKRTKQIPLWDLKRNPAALNFNDSTIPIPVVNQYEGPTAFNSESFSKNKKLYAEGAIEYNNNFGKHNVTGLMLGTMERYYDGGNQLPFNYEGLVARLVYNFDSKYFADVNMGYNGSENFAVGKQFGFFPSFSAGYTISKESFFPNIKAVDYVKIRGSYGTVGNDKIGGNRFLFLPSSYILSNTYYLGLNHTPLTGYRENAIGNPNVTWEKATKLNVGTDIKMFKNKLSISADYFSENRDAILWNLNVPITFGSTSLISPYNIGQAENKGLEVEIGFKDAVSSNGFSYFVNGNFTYARNKIIYSDETPQPFPGLATTGNRIGQPKGLRCLGIYNSYSEINDPKRPISIWEGIGLKPGDLKYEDINGDGKIDDNDAVNIGHPNIPEIIYGSSLGVAYKGFELSLFFQGAANVSTYLQGEGAWPFVAGTKAAFESAKESWSQARFDNNETISLPRLTASPEAGKHNYRVSSFWLQNAAYIRLKNLELGYTFSGRSINRMGMKMFRLYVSGQNLLTFTHLRYFDPEIPSSNGAIYPMTRILNVGANIQF